MMSLPNDSEGNICGYGDADGYTILYYPNINDPVNFDLFQSKRVCVSKCPTKSDKKVDCFATNTTSCNSLIPVQSAT